MLGGLINRVRGNSMAPTLADGDYVIGRRLSRRRPLRPGDIVVIDHPRYGRMVKRVATVDPDGSLTLKGDNAATVASVDIGRVQPKDVRNLVWFRVSPAGCHSL